MITTRHLVSAVAIALGLMPFVASANTLPGPVGQPAPWWQWQQQQAIQQQLAAQQQQQQQVVMQQQVAAWQQQQHIVHQMQQVQAGQQVQFLQAQMQQQQLFPPQDPFKPGMLVCVHTPSGGVQCVRAYPPF